MKNSKIKKTIVLTLLLLMTISGVTLGIESVIAQEVAHAAIYPFVAVTPAGLNQDIIVVIFMSSVTPDAIEHLGSRWENIDVTITLPDGTSDSRHFDRLDAVASAYFVYKATQLGTYTFQAHFPGQTIPPFFNPLGLSSPVPVEYAAADSPVVSITVTEQQAPAPHDIPLPTGYWTRPISGDNANWWMISSNWLLPAWDHTGRQFDQGSAYARVAPAPDSPHIIWATPITFGGLAGGEFGGTSFHNGQSYEQFFKPPVIIAGRVYYNSIVGQEPVAGTNTGVNDYTTVTHENASSIICLDLMTGKQILTIPQASCSFGQIYNYISPNQGGTFAYLWDTNGPDGTWKMYDAWTGDYILSLANVPAVGGNSFVLSNHWGGMGDVLIYTVDVSKGTLSMWNSSRVILPRTTPELNPFLPPEILALAGQNPYTWRPQNYQGITFNATGTTALPGGLIGDTNGYQWEVPIKDFAALNATGAPTIVQIGYDDTIWLRSGYGPSVAVFSVPPYETWASYSMTDGSQKSGIVNIDVTTQLPLNGTIYEGVSMPRVISSDGIWPVYCKEALSLFAWNVKTGQFAWGPTKVSNNGWSLFNWETDFVVDNLVYNWGFDGVIHAVNVNDGTVAFNFDAGIAGTQNPYGTNALYQGLLVADGKIFAQTGDHGNGAQPLYQGEKLFALDQKTGQSLWNMSGWFTQPVLGDGIMLSQNVYDNLIYAFSKGPTAVTVTAPEVGVPAGEIVLIQGTVTDQSPGTTSLGIPAAGTPAISDVDMANWMAYLYEGKPKPSASGVPVKVTATASDGSVTDIGTVVSDANGQFKIEWIPGSSGLYTINAEFGGTNSYYRSEAHTGLSVGSTHPQATATPNGTTTDTVVIYLVVATVVILIALAVAVVVLRKK